MKSHRGEIYAIALPAIVSNITTPLLSMADMAIAGHIGAAQYIGAIALGGSMFNMLYWIFGFLRMGSSGTTAQAYGAKDRRKADTILHRATATGLVAGAVIMALSGPIATVMLKFLEADAATAAEARTYFMTAVTGAPATLATFALTGWFLGMQDSKTPMWIAILTNIVNIAASVALVFGAGMKIEGVAIGSSVAQWSGLIVGLAAARRKFGPQWPGVGALCELKEVKRFFVINSDIFLRTLCLVSVTLWFTRSGSARGVDILAANALLLQLFMFFSYFMDGFGFAGEALAGKYKGMADTASLKRLITDLTRTAIRIAVAFTVIYLIGGKAIVALLTDDSTVREVCGHYLLWAAAIPLAGAPAFIWDGILIGLTHTRIMLAGMGLAAATFFAVYFAATPAMGNHGLWLAFVCFLLVRGLAETGIYRAYTKKRPAE